MDEQVILEAYALIGEKTPILGDCGALCGAACCAPDEDGRGGMYLFPGEEGLLLGAGDDFAPLYTCDGACRREHRPLACRIFPLTPVKGEKGWTVRMDRRARILCPLAKSGIRGLDPGFVRSVRAAIRHLAKEPAGAAFLEKWQMREDEFRAFRL